MPRVKVSVIVPVHNTGKYVDECAPSLLGQSLPADEETHGLLMSMISDRVQPVSGSEGVRSGRCP